VRLAAALLLVACGGGGSGGTARPEVKPVGYLAAGTVGQDPESGAFVFTGNPLAVGWAEGELLPLDGLDGAVAAFRQARVVSGFDRRGKPVRVTIAASDPPSEGMFTMRLGGTVDTGGADGSAVLLSVPGLAIEPVPWLRATVPEATADHQERRLRAALAARPPHDECGDHTYDLVENVAAAAGRRVGKGGPLAISYKVTVNTRARSDTGEPLSALFLDGTSSVEPPYLGICRDHPAWRADPELAVRLDGRASFLLLVTSCGCEQEDWQLVPANRGVD